MKIYVPAEQNRLRKHTMYVAPGADKEFTKGDVPTAWLDHEGKPATFTVEFVNGVADVDGNLAKYMLERGLARKTALIMPGEINA